MYKNGKSIEQIRADVKITIGGGQNEPRDVIAGAIDALLSNPDQLAHVKSGKAGWRDVFNEYVRLISPIGVVTRKLKQAVELKGVQLEKGDTILLVLSSANRDESVFEQADKFNILRDTSKHIAFCKGDHFCGGAHVSRALIADVALPKIFARLPNLRLVEETVYGGWFFRGPVKMRVAWGG
jgi:cytochrome P450